MSAKLGRRAAARGGAGLIWAQIVSVTAKLDHNVLESNNIPPKLHFSIDGV
jgi:hypothetical protein